MSIAYWEITLRLVLAVVFGFLIGSERHHKGKPVGMRTHAIICLAGALISIIGLCGFDDTSEFMRDPTRLSVGVLTGLGFLGAGVIWQDKGGVQGLTTAATIYATACVGLTVGFGYYYLATLSTVLIFLILFSEKFLKRFDKKQNDNGVQDSIDDIETDKGSKEDL